MGAAELMSWLVDTFAPLLIIFLGTEFREAITALWGLLRGAAAASKARAMLFWRYTIKFWTRRFHILVLGLVSLDLALAVLDLLLGQSACRDWVHYPWYCWLTLFVLMAPPMILSVWLIARDSGVRRMDFSRYDAMVQTIRDREQPNAELNFPIIPGLTAPDQIPVIMRQREEFVDVFVRAEMPANLRNTFGPSNRSPIRDLGPAILLPAIGGITLTLVNVVFVGMSNSHKIFADSLTLLILAMFSIMFMSIAIGLQLLFDIAERAALFTARPVNSVYQLTAQVAVPGITDTNVEDRMGAWTAQFVVDFGKKLAGVILSIERLVDLIMGALFIYPSVYVLMASLLIGLISGWNANSERAGNDLTEGRKRAGRIAALVMNVFGIGRVLLTYVNAPAGYPLQKAGGWLVRTANTFLLLGTWHPLTSHKDYSGMVGNVVRLSLVYMIPLALLVGAIVWTFVAGGRSRQPEQVADAWMRRIMLGTSITWLCLMIIGATIHPKFENPFEIPVCVVPPDARFMPYKEPRSVAVIQAPIVVNPTPVNPPPAPLPPPNQPAPPPSRRYRTRAGHAPPTEVVACCEDTAPPSIVGVTTRCADVDERELEIIRVNGGCRP